ncbi:MAG TPA: gliding motility protein GldL [Bacteroidales bacterium]|nr:gliding motility protein GldL [Bacteroidales bacterium]
MSFTSFLRTKKYKKVMSMIYGIGASVVIIGALFKINHYQYANELLAIGLITEAIIFFFSAFEPPHIEPDWSLVYPQLAGMYHEDPIQQELHHTSGASQQLDKLFKEANIDKDTIEKFGQGLRKISEQAGQLSQLGSAVAATSEFSDSLKNASKNVSELAGTYKKASDALSKDAIATVEFVDNMKGAAENAAKLSSAYGQAAEAIRKEALSTEELTNTVKTAAQSAKMLADSYVISASTLKKSMESLDFGKVDGEAYNKQLQQIAKNMAALNQVYEMQLQGAAKNAEAADSLQKTMNQYLEKMTQTAANTQQLNQQMTELNQRISALNKVYGNMLSAMNFKA